MLIGTQVIMDYQSNQLQVSQFTYLPEKGELLQSGYVYLPEEKEETTDGRTD